MVNWYPGHMAKARRTIGESVALADLIVEVTDARIPASSRYRDSEGILSDKKRIIVLNKLDLADNEVTEAWIAFYQKHVAETTGVSAVEGWGLNKLAGKIKRVGADINKKMIERERRERPIRIIIAGIPNVGKSSLINLLAGSGKVKTGKNPGVTRGQQWIKIGKMIELMDTPGLLPPSLDEEEVAYKLAITGAIEEKHFDIEAAACRLIDRITEVNPSLLTGYYGLSGDSFSEQIAYDILSMIGQKRGCLLSGGRIDRGRAAKILLDDYRQGKLGRLSLEFPPEMEEIPE